MGLLAGWPIKTIFLIYLIKKLNKNKFSITRIEDNTLNILLIIPHLWRKNTVVTW